MELMLQNLLPMSFRGAVRREISYSNSKRKARFFHFVSLSVRMTFIRHIINLFFLSLILTPTLFAQKADVRGVVVDSSSGEKIPYATITVMGTTRGAVTNNNGFYLLANLPHGTYQIVATSLGFEPITKTVIVRGKDAITVNFNLYSKPVEVNEVVITGGRKKELEEINTSIHVLDQKELQKVPVAAQDDLFRSIQIIPGIVSSADVNSKFYVRGGAGDQNLILLDGMKIYNPYHAFGIFSIFDPDIIKTTEVYTGAFPAGYGGRLSSVINLVSRNGNQKEFHGNASLNFISGKVQLEGPVFDQSSWIISARKSLFNDAFKNFLKDPAPISFYDLFAKVNLGGSEYGRQSVQMFVSGDDIISPKSFEADHRWRTTSFAVTFSDLIEERIYVDAVAYGSSFSIARDAKQSPVVRSAESAITDGGIRGELTIYTETKDMYFLGFDVNVPRYLYKYITPSNLNVEVQNTAIETWAWFRYQLNYDRLKADIGVHSDIISLFNGYEVTTSFQPRVNVSYLLESDWRLKLSYGIFSQNLITLTNEDDIISLFEAWIFIPSTLEPEVAHHYIAGIEGNIFSELSLNMQVYRKDYKSLVVYNREKKFAQESDYINGYGDSYGVETLFRYRYSWLDLYVAYTLGWTSVTTGNFTYSPRYDRRHTLNILNSTQLSENLDIGIRWEFGSGYPYTQTVGFYERVSFPELGREPFQGENGRAYSILGEKNTARLPVYHRMDINLTYKYSYDRYTGNFGVNLVNVYNNKNILYYDRKTLQTITMLPFFPSAFVKVEF